MGDELEALGQPLETADNEIHAQEDDQGAEPSGAIHIVEAQADDPVSSSRAEVFLELMLGHPLRQEGADDGEYGEREKYEQRELQRAESFAHLVPYSRCLIHARLPLPCRLLSVELNLIIISVAPGKDLCSEGQWPSISSLLGKEDI